MVKRRLCRHRRITSPPSIGPVWTEHATSSVTLHCAGVPRSISGRFPMVRPALWRERAGARGALDRRRWPTDSTWPAIESAMRGVRRTGRVTLRKGPSARTALPDPPLPPVERQPRAPAGSRQSRRTHHGNNRQIDRGNAPAHVRWSRKSHARQTGRSKAVRYPDCCRHKTFSPSKSCRCGLETLRRPQYRGHGHPKSVLRCLRQQRVLLQSRFGQSGTPRAAVGRCRAKSIKGNKNGPIVRPNV